MGVRSIRGGQKTLTSLKSYPFQLIDNIKTMIFHALGLGLMILVLQALVPAVFYEIEQTALAFFRGAQVAIDVATMLAGAAQALDK